MGSPVVRQHFCQYLAKTAHSWQKLSPPKLYYNISHFACSPDVNADQNLMVNAHKVTFWVEQVTENHGNMTRLADEQSTEKNYFDLSPRRSLNYNVLHFICIDQHQCLKGLFWPTAASVSDPDAYILCKKTRKTPRENTDTKREK